MLRAAGAAMASALDSTTGAESLMVALGIIFGFIALYGILNLIEFKRID